MPRTIVPMVNPEWYKPQPLKAEWIAECPWSEMPGAFALGKTNSRGIFEVGCLGRSDTDVREILLECAEDGSFAEFRVWHFPTVRQAFEKECRLWHYYSPSTHPEHPLPPEGADWPCPVRGCPYHFTELKRKKARKITQASDSSRICRKGQPRKGST